MTLGIPLTAFIIDTSEEPLVTSVDGVSVIRIAYNRADMDEGD